MALDQETLERLGASGPVHTGNTAEEEFSVTSDNQRDVGEVDDQDELKMKKNDAQPKTVNIDDYLKFITYNPFDYSPHKEGTAPNRADKITKKENSYAIKVRPFESFKLSKTTRLLDPWKPHPTPQLDPTPPQQ